MFLNYIKELLIKKKVKNSLSNVKADSNRNKIKSIGILVDENYFFETESLMNELIDRGFLKEDIQILAYREKIKKNEVLKFTTFTPKDLSWNAKFQNTAVDNFINQEFDLLINYYDVEKAPLLMVSNLSKANFKTGFYTIDKRLNHFIVNTNAENYKVFIEELFLYLKILNKL